MVARQHQKEETRLHGAPAVLDGSPAVQVRKKTTHSSSLSTPKRLTFLNQTEASAIARLAAAQCGMDDGELAAMLMARPVMASTRVFDMLQKPFNHAQAEQDLSVLLNHFSSAFTALGGNASAVLSEWSHLHRVVVRDEALHTIALAELYSRAFIHFQLNHINVLLLAALVQASAMDVECGSCRMQCTSSASLSQTRAGLQR